LGILFYVEIGKLITKKKDQFYHKLASHYNQDTTLLLIIYLPTVPGVGSAITAIWRLHAVCDKTDAAVEEAGDRAASVMVR
jgi:hypothetical protein